jgi:hypothetical protein
LFRSLECWTHIFGLISASRSSPFGASLELFLRYRDDEPDNVALLGSLLWHEPRVPTQGYSAHSTICKQCARAVLVSASGCLKSWIAAPSRRNTSRRPPCRIIVTNKTRDVDRARLLCARVLVASTKPAATPTPTPAAVFVPPHPFDLSLRKVIICSCSKNGWWL